MNLFESQPKLIFHGAHHKMGTVWITRVLEAISHKFGLSVQKIKRSTEPLLPESNIVIASHSDLDLERLGDFVGSHMIRDPRDAVVSGYFYHLWTTEAWAHEPREDLDGQSIQQHLKSLNQAEGILFEIRRFEAYVRNRRMNDWNFHDDRILELKYEDLMENESEWFQKLFQHYGFRANAIKTCVQLAQQYSFSVISRRTLENGSQQQHLRSGKSGQWRDVFSDSHREVFKHSLGETLISFGYENDLNW